MFKKSRGATTRQVRSQEKLSAWRHHHKQLFKESLSLMLAKPLSSALTWMVIAISLSLPALMFVTLASIADKTDDWQQGGRITLFLNDFLSEAEAHSMLASLQARPEIESAQYISKQQAWNSLQEQFSEQDMTELVSENPLPAAIELLPSVNDVANLQNLQLVLQNLDGVADILLDIAWVERLQYWLHLISVAVWNVALLLGAAVLLVVGNTIRLNIEAQREQIIIAKLVGATNSFVRRGFLYLGFWYGLMGAVGAWLIVFGCAWLLQQPLSQLGAHYQSEGFIQLTWGLDGTLYLFAGSISCAMVGSWLAVWRHLRDIRPT